MVTPTLVENNWNTSKLRTMQLEFLKVDFIRDFSTKLGKVKKKGLPCWSPPVSIYAPINRVHKQGPKKREKIIRILRVFFFIATIYCQRDIFTLMLRSGKKYHLYLFNLQRIFLFDTVNYWTSYIFFSTFHILQLVFLATVSKSEEKKKAC